MQGLYQCLVNLFHLLFIFLLHEYYTKNMLKNHLLQKKRKGKNGRHGLSSDYLLFQNLCSGQRSIATVLLTPSESAWHSSRLYNKLWWVALH